MSRERSIVIYFTDKTKVAFSFPQQHDASIVMQKIQQLLERAYISIESECTLYTYPRDNIKSIQVCPAPDKLPDTVIQGATLLDL